MLDTSRALVVAGSRLPASAWTMSRSDTIPAAPSLSRTSSAPTLAAFIASATSKSVASGDTFATGAATRVETGVKAKLVPSDMPAACARQRARDRAEGPRSQRRWLSARRPGRNGHPDPKGEVEGPCHRRIDRRRVDLPRPPQPRREARVRVALRPEGPYGSITLA